MRQAPLLEMKSSKQTDRRENAIEYLHAYTSIVERYSQKRFELAISTMFAATKHIFPWNLTTCSLALHERSH